MNPYDFLVFFLALNVSLILRMLLAFGLLAFIYHKVDHDGRLWAVLRYPWSLGAGIFYAFDVAFNVLPVSVWFLDPPRRLGESITERFKNYLRDYRDADRLLDRWRYVVALAFCRFLNRADPGHCGRLPS